MPRGSFYRSQAPQPAASEARPRPIPERALGEEERRKVLDVLHSERFVDQAPAAVYHALLDEGVRFCSIRTMYRILRPAPGNRTRPQPPGNHPQTRTPGPEPRRRRW